MEISKSQLLKAMPYVGPRADVYLPWLNVSINEFEVNTTNRLVPFLAQLAHETGQLATVSENLNYTPQAIIATFNRKVKRFTPEQAEMYGRTKAHKANQEMIANIAYANRMGNRGPESGDGWLHRGAGAFQLTGKDNQQKCADYFGIPIDKIGEWLRSPEGAMRSAGWFWRRAGCNRMADFGDFDAISDAINIGRDTVPEGDAIGYKDRLAHFNHIREVLA